MKTLALSAFLYGSCFSQQNISDSIQSQSIPPEITSAFEQSNIDLNYEISFHLNPFYLRGDFDGDNRSDYAVLIKHRKSGAIGIAIVIARSQEISIMWAGIRRNDWGREDLSGINVWYVYPKGKVRQGSSGDPPPKLIGDALRVAQAEGADAIVYWTGKQFLVYPQSD